MALVESVDDYARQSMRIDAAADACQTFRMDRRTLNSSWNSFGASTACDA